MSIRRRPFPLLDVMPAELDGVVLDFSWDIGRLRRLDLPETELHVSDLAWHLGLPFWSDGGRPFRVTPMQVAVAPHRYPEQYARTKAADLTYPLDLVERPNSPPTILDGVHRLLKAHLCGHQAVRVRTLPWACLDAIATRGDSKSNASDLWMTKIRSAVGGAERVRAAAGGARLERGKLVERGTFTATEEAA